MNTPQSEGLFATAVEFSGEEAVTAIERRKLQRCAAGAEIRLGGEELRNPFVVLDAEQRTGHVDQTPARADGDSGLGKDGVLGLGIGGELTGGQAPLGIRVAPPRPGTGARGIDEDEIAAPS